MKAAVRTRYGPPEVVRIADVAKPTPRDDELLVRVHATTVNRTDSGWLAVKPLVVRLFTGLTRPRLTVLGNEYAGRVEAVGAGVTAFTAGDRVFGFTGLRFGAHAEYLAVPQDDALATMPAGLTWEQAAPSSEGAHYALTMIRKARVRGGQAVLVNGATGAIGSAAVQLLANLGAQVTAVCGAEHAELVEGLGADRVIDYRAEDFTRDAQAYDVVLDAVGKSSFLRCRRLLRPRGLYLSSDAGPLSQSLLWLLVTPLLGGRKVLFSVPRRNQETMGHLKGLIESGAFKPLVDRRYPLDRIVEAYRYVQAGQKLGNVVIDVTPSA